MSHAESEAMNGVGEVLVVVTPPIPSRGIAAEVGCSVCGVVLSTLTLGQARDGARDHIERVHRAVSVELVDPEYALW